MKHIVAFFLIFLMLAPSVYSQGNASQFDRPSGEEPDLLSFDELVTLSSAATPDEDLGAKLNKLLTIPFVDNKAAADGVQPHRPVITSLGPVLRVGLWNIERGLNFDLIRSALSDTNEFERYEKDGIRSSRQDLIESQLATLQNADVLVLNEVDLGMKRTDYRDVAHELARALHMNYAYGVEFVEADPVFDLVTEKVHLPDAQADQHLQEDLSVDRDRYHGLHGTAILSRYPIQNTRILRLPVCYDWYGKEAKEMAQIEKGKRWAANKLFRERIEREVRRGGRMALIADIAVSELPSGRATIVATHLENHCAPSCPADVDK
jgi:hypothetical protein